MALKLSRSNRERVIRDLRFWKAEHFHVARCIYPVVFLLDLLRSCLPAYDSLSIVKARGRFVSLEIFKIERLGQLWFCELLQLHPFLFYWSLAVWQPFERLSAYQKQAGWGAT